MTRDLSNILPGADWRDCFEGKVDDHRPHSLDVARRLLDHPPAWISGLMALRNTIVAVFGLKTVALAAGESAGGFPVISSSPERTVLGFDDRHLDFRDRGGSGTKHRRHCGPRDHSGSTQEPVRANLSLRRRPFPSAHRAGDDAAFLPGCSSRSGLEAALKRVAIFQIHSIRFRPLFCRMS